MPELPEVETIVRDLRRLVTGSTITNVAVVQADLIEGPPDRFVEQLSDSRISETIRRAKNIVFVLNGERLIINLGMTGRVLVMDGAAPDPPYTGARFDLDDGRKIIYHDVRRFGRLSVMVGPAWEERSASLGLEPLDADFTAEALHRLSRSSRVAIKPWLMDQKRIVGVGNIYASEALFRAGIDPRKPALRLTRPKAAALHQAIRAVLQEAIDFRGTTLLDYRDAAGGRGEFSSRLQVYDRAGAACHRCESPISRIVQGGRSTFFCPKCQR